MGSDQRTARTRQHDYLYSEAELTEWIKRIEHIGRYADSTTSSAIRKPNSAG